MLRSSIPKTVEGPRVAGASGRVVVPELGQEESSAGAVEAAGGLLGARAAERGVVGAGLSISEDAGCKLHGRQGQHACGGHRLLVEGHCEGRLDGLDGLEQRLGVWKAKGPGLSGMEAIIYSRTMEARPSTMDDRL